MFHVGGRAGAIRFSNRTRGDGNGARAVFPADALLRTMIVRVGQGHEPGRTSAAPPPFSGPRPGKICAIPAPGRGYGRSEPAQRCHFRGLLGMRDCGRIRAGSIQSGHFTTKTGFCPIRARENALQGPALLAPICRIRAGTGFVPQKRKFPQVIRVWKPFPDYQYPEYLYINRWGENIRLKGWDHL